MNQNTPNPGLALGWPIFVLYPLNGVVEVVPECQPSTTGGTGLPDLAVGKRRRWEKSSSAEGIMLNSRGEHRTKTLEETEAEQQTLGDTRTGETRGNQQRCFPHYVNSPQMSVTL